MVREVKLCWTGLFLNFVFGNQSFTGPYWQTTSRRKAHLLMPTQHLSPEAVKIPQTSAATPKLRPPLLSMSCWKHQPETFCLRSHAGDWIKDAQRHWGLGLSRWRPSNNVKLWKSKNFARNTPLSQNRHEWTDGEKVRNKEIPSTPLYHKVTVDSEMKMLQIWIKYIFYPFLHI